MTFRGPLDVLNSSTQQNLIYLSKQQIAELQICESEIINAVEAIFVQQSLGRALQKPKINLSPNPGYVVEALAGIDLNTQRAAVKWVSVSLENRSRGLPNVQAMIILSETESGTPLAIMDGTWITGVRTAACTAVAAKYLALRQSTSLSFIGAGYQARTHLEMISHLFPTLRKVTFYAGESPNGNEFIEFIESRNLEALRVYDPRQAVEGHDIIVSTIPPLTTKRFLDPTWVSPGAFVSSVDLGRPWLVEGWANTFDFTVTDDKEQSEEWGRLGKMLIPDRFDAEIGDLALKQHSGRTNSEQKTALLFAGVGLADVAIASIVFDAAIKNQIGTTLPA